MLDEFAAIGRLEEIKTALGGARDYSIQLAMVLQSLSQLRAHYEKEWPLFFAGSGAIASFAPKDWRRRSKSRNIAAIAWRWCKPKATRADRSRRKPSRLSGPKTSCVKWGRTVNLIEPCPWPVLADVPVYPQTPYADGLDPNPYYRG